jgi:hypothetical protein
MYAAEGNCVNAAPKSKMELSLESVYERALKLNDSVNDLAKRLSPVSTPQQEEKCGTSAVSPCKSQGYMLDQLDMIANQIDKTHSAVLAALSVLEI